MANNYTPAYKNYLSNSAGYTLPSSVRTYSVFDPSSNSWKRMTNDGMSPIQQGGNAQDVQAALRYAQSSQGKVWDGQSAQPAPVPTQTPGILLRPRVQGQPQTPVQMPLGGSRTPSPASRGGTVVVPMGQPKAEAPAGSQAVPAGNPYMGYAESRREFEDPDAFLHEVPRGTAGVQGQKPVVATARPVNLEEVSQVFQPPMDRGYQFNEPVRRPFDVRRAIDEEYNNIPLRLHQAYGLMGGGLNVGPALASFRAGDASVAAARKAYQEGMMRSQLRQAAPSRYTQTVHPEAPTIEAANRFSPMSSPWSPPQGTITNNIIRTPTGATYTEKLALEAPVYPRYAYPPKPASIPNMVSRADVNRASQAAENALRGRYSNVGGGLSTGKVVPRATVRLGTGDTSSIWANAGRGFQRYQTLQGNPRAFDPIPSTLQQVYNARVGIPSIGFLAR